MFEAVEEPVGWEPTAELIASCEPQEYVTPLGDENRDRLLIRLVVDDGDQIVQFSIVQMTLCVGRWHEVAEIDSRHGCIHLHRCASSVGGRIGTREDVKFLAQRVDVQDGYGEAMATMLTNWQTYRESWERA